MTVPTIQELCRQLDAYERGELSVDATYSSNSDDEAEAMAPSVNDDSNDLSKRRRLAAYKKTALCPFMDVFETFLMKLEHETRLTRREQKGKAESTVYRWIHFILPRGDTAVECALFYQSMFLPSLPSSLNAIIDFFLLFRLCFLRQH